MSEIILDSLLQTPLQEQRTEICERNSEPSAHTSRETLVEFWPRSASSRTEIDHVKLPSSDEGLRKPAFDPLERRND